MSDAFPARLFGKQTRGIGKAQQGVDEAIVGLLIYLALIGRLAQRESTTFTR